jgi:hypothetical protein
LLLLQTIKIDGELAVVRQNLLLDEDGKPDIDKTANQRFEKQFQIAGKRLHDKRVMFLSLKTFLQHGVHFLE